MLPCPEHTGPIHWGPVNGAQVATVEVMEATYDVLEAIERQAASCDHIGSPLYGIILRGLAADFIGGGVTRELLDGVSERPQHDAIPLRYLATGHRLALSGEAPELAQHFASCGGLWRGGDPTDDFLEVVTRRRADFAAGLTHQVQTNEVGRAVVLGCGLGHIALAHGLPLRTLEVGASAGLLSRLPWFRIDTGLATCGPEDALLGFGPEWIETPPTSMPALIDVVEQAASDAFPIDIATPDGALAIQSFVWPDQTERLARLRAALVVAEQHPLEVERADAGEWLERRLATPLPLGATTVVFHSIVWQYLPPTTRQAVRSCLLTAGEAATPSSPLCWLRMEPATATHADLRLTSWPGGEEIRLAEVGYHGHRVDWRL